MKKLFFILIISTFFVAVLTDVQNCTEFDIRDCHGPILFYEELNCTPIRINKSNCCPDKYECPERKKDKCYIHGKEYNIRQEIDEKDSGPCEFCRCLDQSVGYRICPEIRCNERWPCVDDYLEEFNVNGKTIKRYFFLTRLTKNFKSKILSYKGVNYNNPFCEIDIKYFTLYINNYPPIYSAYESRKEACPISYKASSVDDIFYLNGERPLANDTQPLCKYGPANNMLFRINEALYNENDGIYCICEIPPFLTCVTGIWGPRILQERIIIKPRSNPAN